MFCTLEKRSVYIFDTGFISFSLQIGGKAARMKLDAFKARPVWANIHNEEIVSSLSATEKELSKRYINVNLLFNRYQ